MKNFPHILIVFIFLGAISGCIKSNDETRWQQIASADSLMFINPDSSLKIISGIGDIENNNKATQAYYHLISTQAKSRNRLLKEDDTTIIKSVNYYSRSNNDPHRLAWSLVYASEVKKKAGNDSLALKYIREAAAIATDNQITDERLNTFIYNFWGDILYGKRPFHDAIDKYLIAERHARLINDTSRIISNFIDIGTLYTLNHEYNTGRNYLERAVNLINAYQEKSKRLPRIYELIGTSYYMEGDNENALSWITKAINSAKEHDFVALRDLYLFKAEILTESGKLDSVAYFIELGNSRKDDINYAQQAIIELTRAKYEAACGDYKEAYLTHKKYSSLIDSMYKEREQNRVAEFQRRYDYQDVAMERDRLKIESQAKNIRWLWTAVSLLVIALAALGYAYIQRRKRVKAEISRELSITSAVTAIEDSMRQELLRRDRHIEHLRNRVLMMDSALEKIRLLRDASQKERATESTKFMMTAFETEHMLATVDMCHEGFVEGLRKEYASLTDKDVEICALIKLGLQSRDIALLTGMSDNTLKTRKKRMKKEKLGREMTDIQFDDWIRSKNYGKTADDEQKS